VPGAGWRALVPGFLCAILAAPAWATEPPVRAALVVDDLGYSLSRGQRALALPVPATYGILPYTPYATELAERAQRVGKEVILHLPMAANDGRETGPGALRVSSGVPSVEILLRDALATVPRAVGVSNHMGSMATRDPSLMRPLMRALAKLGGYFLDSRTTTETIACHTAVEHGVPAIERDVFLDVDPSRSAMRFQWRRWQQLARRQGSAVAIAHPHPDTLTFLEEMLADPAARGMELVPLSRLLSNRAEDHPPCRPYSFPLPKVAKSSRPSP
jgi:polysaccharide deacetylase 2 family uncharacterized protein YibQ